MHAECSALGAGWRTLLLLLHGIRSRRGRVQRFLRRPRAATEPVRYPQVHALQRVFPTLLLPLHNPALSEALCGGIKDGASESQGLCGTWITRVTGPVYDSKHYVPTQGGIARPQVTHIPQRILAQDSDVHSDVHLTHATGMAQYPTTHWHGTVSNHTLAWRSIHVTLWPHTTGMAQYPGHPLTPYHWHGADPSHTQVGHTTKDTGRDRNRVRHVHQRHDAYAHQGMPGQYIQRHDAYAHQGMPGQYI